MKGRGLPARAPVDPGMNWGRIELKTRVPDSIRAEMNDDVTKLMGTLSS